MTILVYFMEAQSSTVEPRRIKRQAACDELRRLIGSDRPYFLRTQNAYLIVGDGNIARKSLGKVANFDGKMISADNDIVITGIDGMEIVSPKVSLRALADMIELTTPVLKRNPKKNGAEHTHFEIRLETTNPKVQGDGVF